jgi:hypothetical protein
MEEPADEPASRGPGSSLNEEAASGASVSRTRRVEQLTSPATGFRPDLAMKKTPSGIPKDILALEILNAEFVASLAAVDDDDESQWSAIRTDRSQGPNHVHIKRLRAMFDAYDKDQSGAIDYSEFAAILRDFNVEKSPAEITQMMNDADLDGNGVIDFDEFTAIFSRQQQANRGGLGEVFAQKGLLGLFAKEK